MKSLLFEIGAEEIPARFVTAGVATLKKDISQLLDDSFINYGTISEFATPRRLAVYIENVHEKQKDRTVEHTGPPKKVAYDNSGAPTKSAIGFAKSLNMDINDLQIKQTDRGEYVSASVKEKGKPTEKILAEALPTLISSLKLQKSMRWGNGSLKFFRPIHWILALFGDAVISFDLDGIKSNNISYGHRFLSPVAIKVGNPSAYLNLLKQNHVLADPADRKNTILEGINKIESAHSCKVHKDDELLNTIINLVEYPTVVYGSFDEHFLDLPKELLITVMKTHQKYFSVEDSDGNMQPSFIVVSNTNSDNNDMVRKGAERVLRARLEDARFYVTEDQETSLWDHKDKLKKVTFQEKLGSLYDKAERIANLSSFLAEQLGLESKEMFYRASMLCKADLTTGIIGEFPELQGYMGMTYALNSGEDKDTASAIFEHYLPKFTGDTLPSGQTGSILSIADKMDNIASFFYLDLIPTGSEDPFALRRQAAGIINILLSKEYSIALDMLIDKSLQNLGVSNEDRKPHTENILQFFYLRIENIFLSHGYSADVINATIQSESLIIKNMENKMAIISSLKKENRFPELLIAAKRVYNILVKFPPSQIKESMLTEPEEKKLFNSINEVKDKLIKSNFEALFELEIPINAFFDNILVMDEDNQKRENRLALLFAVKCTFDALGNFSKLAD